MEFQTFWFVHKCALCGETFKAAEWRNKAEVLLSEVPTLFHLPQVSLD